MNDLSRRTLLGSLAAAAAAGLHEADAAGTGKVVYWHHFTSQEEFTGLKRVMELFAKKYPAIALQQENIPNPEYMAKFTAAVVANTRPDVSMVAAERLPDMMAMNGLVDLTSRVNAWSNKANYPDDRWKGSTLNGKIYGVPAFTFVDWTYYRKDWFEEAGIAGPPKNLEEFVTVARKLTDPSKNRYGFGMRAGPGGASYIIDLMEAFGSKFVVDGKWLCEPASTNPIPISSVRPTVSLTFSDP